MTDEAKTAAADTNANDEYATRDLGVAPLPPAIHEDALDVARDPELTTAAREEAADEADLPEPVGAEPEAERLSGDYDKANTEALDAEIEARRAEGSTIEVTGTGRDGNVVNADRVKALEADDAAKATA